MYIANHPGLDELNWEAGKDEQVAVARIADRTASEQSILLISDCFSIASPAVLEMLGSSCIGYS